MCVSKKQNGNDIIKCLDSSIFAVPITKIPVIGVGAAKNNIEKEDYYLDLKLSPKLKCPAACYELVIHHDGYVYPCCSPAVFDTILIIGSIKDYSIKQLEKKLLSNIVLYLIQKEGLNWFIEKLREKGVENIPEYFVSVCDVCHFIFKNENNLELLTNDIMEYYDENFKKV